MKSKTVKLACISSLVATGLFASPLFAEEGAEKAKEHKEHKEGKKEENKGEKAEAVQVKAEPLSISGILSKKEGKYSVETAEKVTVKIPVNDKSKVKAEDLDKLEGKTVEVKGSAITPAGSSPKFTHVDSVTEQAPATK